MSNRPRVLVSNDDGIQAPGIIALVHALGIADFCEVYVSAPSGERSASSHAITLGQQICAAPAQMSGSTLQRTMRSADICCLHCDSISAGPRYQIRACCMQAGALEAFAVDAKPADCTMLGLRGLFFQAGTDL